MNDYRIIHTENLQRVFGTGSVKTYALRGVNISIFRGEFVAIMGPSGSGKSTLLHLLGLLDDFTEGNVIIDGNEVVNLTEEMKTKFRLEKLGYVFQNYNLLTELTALENVYLTSMARGLDKNEYLKTASDILKQVGLEDRMNHYPSELSGGQQQRVSIARALVNQPKILFADEPTANLDTVTSDEIIKLFRQLNEKNGQTIVMVTHEMEEGNKADRIIWMRDGLLDESK